MIRTREELLETFKTVVGEDEANDNVLTLLEDLTDTINDLESKATGTINVKETEEYKELENTWRKRYRDRFFSSVTQPDDKDEPDDFGEHPEVNSPKHFEDLFSKE